MIQIKNNSECCGCTACANVCTHNAITMKPDAMGFLYPQIDKNKCVDCGLCDKVCTFNDNYDKSLNFPKPIVFAARHRNVEEVETSRSGAVFIAISDWILNQGGVVYGVGYADNFRVVHKRANSRSELIEFKGSKYVQSDSGDIFRQVKKDLMNDLLVLFSGTPCQTAALRSYIGKKWLKNLFLVDIVCHGVSSPFLWRDFLAYLEKKQNDKICGVNFRDKQRFGWSAHRETFDFVRKGKMCFDYSFYGISVFRYSCSKCHFCNTKRPSDITIGDFWGWEKIDSDVNMDDKGLSLVLVNTEKGEFMFSAIKMYLHTISARLEDCMQPNLQSPTPLPSYRASFERIYKEKGFVYVMKHYGYMGWRFRLRKFKQRILNRIIRIIS